jgi:hypothetical protein
MSAISFSYFYKIGIAFSWGPFKCPPANRTHTPGVDSGRQHADYWHLPSCKMNVKSSANRLKIGLFFVAMPNLLDKVSVLWHI